MTSLDASNKYLMKFIKVAKFKTSSIFKNFTYIQPMGSS